MSKLSAGEIRERRRRMQEEALRSVAKTEQLNLRIDETSILRLYKAADCKGKPVGTMVREWIQDRLSLEENPSKKPANIETLIEMISSLHTKIDHLQDMPKLKATKR
jgi:hypothetical protein